MRSRVLSMVMAGGTGTRLFPLTADRSKPAVPFGGRYQIVDFVLSNLLNSGLHSIYLLVQYKSQSLIDHIEAAWSLSPVVPDQFVKVVPPQMREGPQWYLGTSDAIYQNLNLIERYSPDLVAIFGADHIYRMDIRQMVRFHEDGNADVTVAALPIPLEQASSFGVLATDSEGRVQAFEEKPSQPSHMPGDPERAYASMGNYIFKQEVLVEALREGHQRGETDFGKHILPRLLKQKRLMAYDFGSNRVPGIRPYEDSGYWRDVGTLDAYFDASMDLLGGEPRFNLFNPRWPVLSDNYQGPVSRFVEAQVTNSMVGAGCIIRNAKIRNSIIRSEVLIEDGVEIVDSIILDHCIIKAGARLNRCIVDNYNVIPAGCTVDKSFPGAHQTESGLIVIGQGEYSSDFVRQY